MQDRYQYYILTLETAAPVFIGCEEKLSKIDYIFSERSNKVYVLDAMKLFLGLKQYGLLDQFEKGLSRTTSMTDFVKRNSVPETAYSSWAAYSYSSSGRVVDRGQMEIQSFIKDAYGLPYIPGSSLKGALRTILAAGRILQGKGGTGMSERVKTAVKSEHKNAESNRRGYRMKKSFLKYDSNDLECEVFHTLNRKDKKQDIVNDCMAGMIVSDSKPIPRDSLILCQKIDAFLETEQSLPILREAIKSGTSVSFDLTIDTKLFGFSVAELLSSGNQFFQFYDDRFRSAFLDFLPPEIDHNKETYLYLGGGTGFWHKTILNALFKKSEEGTAITADLLDLQFPRARHPAFAESKKLSPKALKATEIGNSLEEMGLCKLRIEEKKQ